MAIRIQIAVILCIIVSGVLFAQENIHKERLAIPSTSQFRTSLNDSAVHQWSRADSSAISSLFGTIQKGIMDEDVDLLSSSFAPQLCINLRGTDGCYYSANQALYIIKNFFGARHVFNFRLSTIGAAQESPYATGSGTFLHKGRREFLQIYVGLTRTDSRWVISQLSVY